MMDLIFGNRKTVFEDNLYSQISDHTREFSFGNKSGKNYTLIGMS